MQLRDIRETIPRIVESVTGEFPRPDLLHSHFKKAARDAAKDLKDFKHLIDQPKSKEALEKAKESRDRDSANITPWLVTEHDDRLDVKKDDSRDEGDSIDKDGDMKSTELEIRMEDVRIKIEEFAKSHEGVSTLFDPDLKTITVCVAWGLRQESHAGILNYSYSTFF